MTARNPDASGIGTSELLVLGADHPLTLSGSVTSWRVVRGVVEIFAIASVNSADVPRLHLTTATTGTVLFGSDEAVADDVRLLAVGGPDSAVQVVPVDSRDAESARRRWLGELAALVIVGLSARTLTADRNTSVTDAPEIELSRAIVSRREQLELDDRELIRTQRNSHQGAFAESLQTLGSLLESDDGTTQRAKDGESPLTGAFRVVLRSHGMSIVPLPPKADDADPLTTLARACGVRTRSVCLDGDWWREDCGPMLGFCKDGHRPVALIPVGPERYELIDTAAASRQPIDDALAATLDTGAFAIYRPLPEGQVGIRALLRAGLVESGKDLVRLVALTGASALLALVVPLVTGQIVGSVIPESNRPELAQLAMALLVAALAGALFQLTTAIAVLRVQGRLDRYLSPALWGRLLSLPTSFFRRYSSGDLAQRVLSSESLVQLISGSAITSVLGGVFSIFSFGLIWFYSVPLGIAATILLFAMVATIILAGRVQLRRMQDVEEYSGVMSGMLLEIVSGISKLRVAGVQEKAFQRWAELFTAKRIRWNSVRTMENFVAVVTAAFPVVSSIILFAVAGLNGHSTLSPAAFLAVNAAYGQVAVALVAMASSVNLVVRAIPGLQRLQPILTETPEEDIAKSDPGTLAGAVEFSGIFFRYQPDGPLILDDISIRIPAGSSIALVGPSGSGKSTLGRLLLGFEEPETGAVFFDDQDLSGLDVRAVRRQLGVVLQSVELLPGSILSNIIGSAVELNIDDAWAAAVSAGLADDIRAMPMGIHTAISEGGSTLSGGQRQRLLIARAMSGNPKILLFDEATSALDNATQAIVAESLAAVDATRILIAHRLSTVIGADQIYYLENGRIVEAGTYGELMALGGAFASQARRQLA